jgi:hypothetical protein
METVRKCVEVYRHIAAQHPTLVRKPQNPYAALPRARSVREGQGNALRPWPEMLGVGISFDAHDTSHVAGRVATPAEACSLAGSQRMA